MFAYLYLFVRLCSDVQLISVRNEIRYRGWVLVTDHLVLVFIGGPKLRYSVEGMSLHRLPQLQFAVEW